jgi:uncharacterized membrane protein YfcA
LANARHACPSIIVGAFLSATLVPKFDAYLFVLLFVGFAVVTSWRLLRRAEKAVIPYSGKVEPGSTATTTLKGMAGGSAAAALGIGGACFVIPILLRFIPMQRAIGTASALAIPLSIAGSAGYILSAPPSGCLQGCVGYVFFPAVAAIGIGAVLTAPLGAWLAHRAPVAILRQVFALFLICAAGHIAYKTFDPELTTQGTQRVIVLLKKLFRTRTSSASPQTEEIRRQRHRPSPQELTVEEPPEPAEPGLPYPALPSEVYRPRI